MLHQDNTDNGIFKTVDIDLATYLSLDHPIYEMHISPVNRHRVVFSFKETPGLNADLKRFRDRTALVEPRVYYNQLRDVRSQINNLIDKQV